MAWNSSYGANVTFNDVTILGKLILDDTTDDKNKPDSFNVNIINDETTGITNQINMYDSNECITMKSNNVTMTGALQTNGPISTNALQSNTITDLNNESKIDMNSSDSITLQTQNVNINANMAVSGDCNIGQTAVNTTMQASNDIPSLVIVDNGSGNALSVIHNTYQGCYNGIVSNGDSTLVLKNNDNVDSAVLDICVSSDTNGGSGIKLKNNQSIMSSGFNSITVDANNGTSINNTCYVSTLFCSGRINFPVTAYGSTYTGVFANSTCTPETISSTYTISCNNCAGILQVSQNQYNSTVVLDSRSGNSYTWTVNVYASNTSPTSGYISYMII